jgi:hypothetical protein
VGWAECVLFTRYYQVDEMREAGVCSSHGELRNTYTILVEILKGRDISEDNIKMDLVDEGFGV